MPAIGISLRRKLLAGNLTSFIDGGGMMGSMGRKEKLRDLLNIPDCDTEIEMHRRNSSMEVVEMLQCEALETRKKGVWMMRKLSKEDAGAWAALAAAGAIPPLVAMIGGGVSEEAALYAAFNLGFRNDVNKAAIVESGAVHKMLKLIESTKGVVRSSITEAVVANLFSLSALDSNKLVIGASGAIKFLVEVIKNKEGLKKKRKNTIIKDALNAVLNLSICKSNIKHILETEAIPVLLKALEMERDLSGRTLSILSNIASMEEGTDAVGKRPESYGIIIEVLRWSEWQECQEKAAYILMVMARKSCAYRKSMADSGAVSALLEVTLLGSTLAQERSSRVLELLTEKKMKIKMNASSSSSSSFSSSSSSFAGYERVEEEEGGSEERKVVRQLVRESLEMNMRRMLERARLVLDF